MKYKYAEKELFPTVEVYHDIIPYLGGINMKEFYFDEHKCAKAWKDANKILFEYYGDLFPMRKPSPAPLSYGHLISIGAPVNVPEDGEPNVSSFASSISEAIDILKEKKGIDFTKNHMFQHYLNMWRYLREQFPDENIPFTGFEQQGPITSAVLMRGPDFYCDIYDEPEKCKEFLTLMTDSIVDYIKCCSKINNMPEVQPNGYIADDFASLISPDMWSEFVIPYWNQRYEGLGSTRSRFVHCENLNPKHLKYLSEAKITHYQPSVSDMLTLENVKENLTPGITFDWLLYSYRITEMSDSEIEEWVDKAVEAGVSIIRTQLGTYTYTQNKLDRIKVFVDAFKKYEKKL